MKLLGIDYGIKRVGLALSDPGARLAFPYSTISRTTRDELFAELERIIAAEDVQGIVLGMPLSHARDSEHPAHGEPRDNDAPAREEEALIIRQIRNFAKSLERRVSLPIHLVDEFLTTQEAVEELRQMGVGPKRRKELKDTMAAVRILETHLATLSPAGANGPDTEA